MTTAERIRAALSEVINAPDRPPALWPLAHIKYPPREVRPVEQPDGSYKVALALAGYEYKHRGPRPSYPPAIDPVEIRIALNGRTPNGLYVSDVEVCETCISIHIILYGGFFA